MTMTTTNHHQLRGGDPLATAVEKQNVHAVTQGISTAIHLAGDNPTRDGVAGTPERWLAAFKEMTSGTHLDPARWLTTTFTNDADYTGPITVGPVGFTSLCEHHLLPFTGTATLTYVPAGRVIVGLSKIPRMFLDFAHRLQVQERLTQQALDCLVHALHPAEAEVTVTAVHSCMAHRGVHATGAMTTRAAYRQDQDR